ncbi:lycopene cyclase domain-containing protein [Demequina salsinemoris]|uniref:lycopene cyclase domain-containing protein n=1 Tax=Demequina salsinemoris TaxID=577470 RepID=UPI000780794C|nr:lycopene cyclase domain-containing protein [Demequina salsinemoris]
MTSYATMMALMLAVVMLAAVPALRRLPFRPVLWTSLVLLALTVIFDNVIVGAGIVGYDDAQILGIRLAVAPIEDLAYALAAALLVPTLWRWTARLAPAGTPDDANIPSPASSPSPSRDDASVSPSEDA